jgi:hypothetical protein
MNRQMILVRILRKPLGECPRDQDAVMLETEVPMECARVVFLNHEAWLVAFPGAVTPHGLGCLVRISHRSVGGQGRLLLRTLTYDPPDRHGQPLPILISSIPYWMGQPENGYRGFRIQVNDPEGNEMTKAHGQAKAEIEADGGDANVDDSEGTTDEDRWFRRGSHGWFDRVLHKSRRT